MSNELVKTNDLVKTRTNDLVQPNPYNLTKIEIDELKEISSKFLMNVSINKFNGSVENCMFALMTGRSLGIPDHMSLTHIDVIKNVLRLDWHVVMYLLDKSPRCKVEIEPADYIIQKVPM